MTASEMKKLLDDDFKKMSEMSVQEYTLYRKWEEVNEKEWTPSELNDIYLTKKSIWKPSTPEDYLKLKPVIVFAEGTRSRIWTTLRIFISTMHWNASPGRLLRFYIMDSVTNTYLGVISLASDFLALGGRDSYIGWTRDQRINDHMINHTGMGSSIVPTQPLGFNYTGGKLMSLLLLSDVIQKTWNDKYDDVLAGITTTSLYGGYSQYNRLRYWHKCNSTEGAIPIEPSDEVYKQVIEWVKNNCKREYDELQEKKISSKTGKAQPKSHPKAKILSVACTKLKVNATKNNFSRGVYFAKLYDNTSDFLCKRTDKLGNKLFDNSVEALTNLWKERYAANRVKNVLENNTYNSDILYYDEMIGMTFEEVKEKYMEGVGR